MRSSAWPRGARSSAESIGSRDGRAGRRSPRHAGVDALRGNRRAVISSHHAVVPASSSAYFTLILLLTGAPNATQLVMTLYLGPPVTFRQF